MNYQKATNILKQYNILWYNYLDLCKIKTNNITIQKAIEFLKDYILR